MENKKDILLFLDLEGTLLSEKTGKFEQDDMLSLLGEIDKLEEITKAKVHIGILSPVFKKDSEKIIDDIDRMIARYNIRNHSHLNEIEFAGADFSDELKGQEELYDKVFPLPKPIDRRETDYSSYGKYACAKRWVEMFQEKGSLCMAIYGGNGQNDIRAMRYIRNLSNGFVMCPSNSRTEIKENIAHFVSDKTDIHGMVENFQALNNEIEKRKPEHPGKSEQTIKETLRDER